jgi:D-alanine-D-alanine ligase-like ATP-grasp enzyme
LSGDAWIPALRRAAEEALRRVRDTGLSVRRMRFSTAKRPGALPWSFGFSDCFDVEGERMPDLSEFRLGKPACYPDQSVYAEYACAELGLAFDDIDGGTGLVFRVASKAKSVYFGAGRCSWYPQNNATAASLASDKYFTNRILEAAGVATLGGEYFFLHDRHRAHRPAGHEREDAVSYFRKLGAAAFVKPLQGSRGDFAQALHGEAELDRYLSEVSQHYDSILIQRVASGIEYRVFLLDDGVVFTARKYPPSLSGDGVHSVRDLLIAHNEALRASGLSHAAVTADRDSSLDLVLAKGAHWEIPGRMNLSAGGTMVLKTAVSDAVVTEARKAARALGLRVAAVDMFADLDGDPQATGVIEVNSNPSIRLLEQSDRGDLIRKIWRHTFSAVGLL